MEHLESLKQQISERFNSPLLLSFGVSWLAWNYKVLVVLFSELEPLVKFELIQRLYPEISDLLGTALLFPALSALTFLLVYPFASRMMLRYNIWHHDLTLEVKAKAAEGRVLLPEEAKLMHENYKSRIESLESEVERRTDIGVKHRDERDKAEALIVEVKLANQKIVSEQSEKIQALSTEYNQLMKTYSESTEVYEAKLATHKEAAEKVSLVERLLLQERAKVEKLMSELEAVNARCQSYEHAILSNRLSSSRKGLPAWQPHELRGIQDLVGSLGSIPKATSEGLEEKE